MNVPFEILIKYPSRSRPDRFFEGMESIVNNLSDKTNFHISCTLDEDDKTMNNDTVKERIAAYPNTSIAWGLSESKIHAINRDMPDYGSIIVVMSDDMKFNMYGWDDDIRVNMNAKFPNFDGVLGYLDKDTHGTLNTMYIAGRNWYQKRGFVYHPSYKSLWCDNEELDTATILGKYHFTGTVIYFHEHPSYGHIPFDSQYYQQQALWNEDEANYFGRKQRNFDL